MITTTQGCYASNTNFAGRTHYHASKRGERVLSPGSGLALRQITGCIDASACTEPRTMLS